MLLLRSPYRLLVFNVSLIIILSGCAKYKPTKLVSYEQATLSYMQEKKNIELHIKAFSEEEFKDHFTQFQALHLHIKNKSAHPYLLATPNISLPLATPEQVNKKAPSLYVRYFLPSIAFSVFGYLFFWEIGIPIAAVLCLWGYQKSWLDNKYGLGRLKEQTLTSTKPITIPPYSSVDSLIFVSRKAYQPEFTLQLTTANSKESVLFNVIVASRSNRVYKTR